MDTATREQVIPFVDLGIQYAAMVAEIGEVIESHLISIGVIQSDKLDEHQKKLIAEKRAMADEAHSHSAPKSGGFPDYSTLCAKCFTKAVVILDNCATCLECGDAKCQ